MKGERERVRKEGRGGYGERKAGKKGRIGERELGKREREEERINEQMNEERKE